MQGSEIFISISSHLERATDPQRCMARRGVSLEDCQPFGFLTPFIDRELELRGK